MKDRLQDAQDMASRIRKAREEQREKKDEARTDLERIKDLNRQLNKKCDALEEANRKYKYDIDELDKHIEDLKKELRKAQAGTGHRDENHEECKHKEAELHKIIEEQNAVLMGIKRAYDSYKKEQDENMSKIQDKGSQEDQHQNQGMDHKKQKTYDSSKQPDGWANYQPGKYSSTGWKQEDQKRYYSYSGDDAQSNTSWKQQDSRTNQRDPELEPYRVPLEEAGAGWVLWDRKADGYRRNKEDKLLDNMAGYWSTEQDGNSIVGEEVIMDTDGWQEFKERNNFEARVITDGKDAFIRIKHILALQAIAAGAHKETRKEDRYEWWWMPFGKMWSALKEGYPDLYKDTRDKFKLVGLMAQAKTKGTNRTLKGPMFQVMMIPVTPGFPRTDYYAYIRLNGPHSKDNPCMVYANGESKWADLIKLGIEGK